jgi:vitamin B12 transporter
VKGGSINLEGRLYFSSFFRKQSRKNFMQMKKRFFVLAAVITSIQLTAQDSTGKLLDEAFVTANRFEQKQDQTGKLVTVINKQQIERSNGKTVAQLLNEQAGIIVNGALNAPGTVQTVYTRGASSGRVMILIDGVPAYDPSMINNEFDLNFISLQDIERIEISRGAQSTLYGSDAIAGVINLITEKKDVKKAFNANLMAAGGNRGTIKTNAGIYGKLDKFSYQGSFSFHHTDGFSAAYDSTGTKNFDRDGMEGDMEKLRIQYELLEGLTAKAWFQRGRYDADIDMNVFIDERDYWITHNNDMGGVGLAYKRGKLQLTSNYRSGRVLRTFINDSAFGSISGIKYEANHYVSHNRFFEVFGNYKATKFLTLLAGVDYRWDEMKQDYFSISFFGPYASSFDDTSLNQVSGYASVFFSLLKDRLKLEAGGRINDHSKYGTNATYTFNPSYTLSSSFRIFGTISSGYKAPTIYQLLDGFSGNPDLKPETSTNYEIGLARTGKSVNTRAVFFHRDIDNGIDFDYNVFRYFNFVSQSVNGFELELRYRQNKWDLNSNYTFITGEERTQSRKTFHDTTYQNLLRRPKHSFNLSIGYQPTTNLFASINLKAVSKRFDTGGFMSEDVPLDGYMILGAYAEYKCKKMLKFFVDLQNITDKKFFDVRGYNSIPITITGGIAVNF